MINFSETTSALMEAFGCSLCDAAAIAMDSWCWVKEARESQEKLYQVAFQYAQRLQNGGLI